METDDDRDGGDEGAGIQRARGAIAMIERTTSEAAPSVAVQLRELLTAAKRSGATVAVRVDPGAVCARAPSDADGVAAARGIAALFELADELLDVVHAARVFREPYMHHPEPCAAEEGCDWCDAARALDALETKGARVLRTARGTAE